MHNQQFLSILFLFLMSLLSTGCASISGSPIHSVHLSSTPKNANYTITNEAGEWVASGTTPDTVSLRSSKGLFDPARYYITYDSQGYQRKTDTVKAHISVWYLVNILASLPGVVGLVIVDPFTGAMFDLPDDSAVILQTGADAS